MELAETLRSKLGGSWEGDEEECQGLLESNGRKLKVTLERDGDAHVCEVFDGGAVVGSARASPATRAVGEALRAWRRGAG